MIEKWMRQIAESEKVKITDEDLREMISAAGSDIW